MIAAGHNQIGHFLDLYDITGILCSGTVKRSNGQNEILWLLPPKRARNILSTEK